MREYYARFFREVGKSMLSFWKSQIAAGLIAGIITAVLDAKNGVTASKLVLESAGAVVIGYLALLGVFAICAIMAAPVKLDRQRVAEIDARDSEIAVRDSAMATKQTQIGELQAALAKKHPHDEHLENQVWSMFEKLDAPERKFVAWLLDIGVANNAQVHNAGFRDVAASLTNRCHLVKCDRIMSVNGLVERDREHSINPKLADALRNVLFGTPRPVAPPPA